MVTGAQGESVRALIPQASPSPQVTAVHNSDYRQGMGSSLRVGLEALDTVIPDVDAVLVMLVDLPDVTAAVVDRLAQAVRDADQPRSVLARAAYRGAPGHPVLLGADQIGRAHV